MYDFLKNTFSGKRIFLTGHNGFKGAWLLQIFQWLGAEVKGFSLPAEKDRDLFHQVDGADLCYASVHGDIRDLQQLRAELVRFEPHFVFHLAAQSLVRRSYEMPADTFMTNAMGTVHLLEALRSLSNPCVTVIVTTDKVYENPELGTAFAEEDKLGGYDPYSSSKAAAEIIVSSYRRSFFPPETYARHQQSVASARAGNVIGGGDYADDRIIPDIVRAIEQDRLPVLRNPAAIRPWQHVLEPLGGYLLLAARMQQDPLRFAGAYNFGPAVEDGKTVEDLTRILLAAFGKNSQGYEILSSGSRPHEAGTLLLNSDKAKEELGWTPRLNAASALYWTAEWYADKMTDPRSKCLRQIRDYFEVH